MTKQDPSPYAKHFGGLAGRYDSLRKDPSDENIAVLAREGDLRDRTVLDVGCGTGRVATVLTDVYGAHVVGIDRALPMLDVARARATNLKGLAASCAEHLPFADAAFDRAIMQMVAHLVDRPKAFAELRRVLRSGGCLVICTLDPQRVEDVWLSRFFPSYARIDRGRFPATDVLAEEMRTAGFWSVACVPFIEPVVYSRAYALALLRGRYASSFALIDDAEYHAGLARAERELEERVEFALTLAVVTARC